MLNLMALKQSRQQQQEQQQRQGDGASGQPKLSAAQIRLQKDLAELGDLPQTLQVHFADMGNLFEFDVAITPDDGFYRGGRFLFEFKLNANYPHEPPKVHCRQRIYHPNVDVEGNVCLNILREDWKPVLNLHAVLAGLLYLFLEPNADDPLNKEAAESLRRHPDGFAQIVTRTMRGAAHNGVTYDKVLVAAAR